MLVGTLLGFEMVYRLSPAAIDERAVVATLRGVLRANEVAPPAGAAEAQLAGTASVPPTRRRRAAGARPALPVLDPHLLEE